MTEEVARRRSPFSAFPDVFASIGGGFLDFLATFGSVSRLTFKMAAAAVRRPWEGRELIRQMHALGTQSLSIAFLTALFTGAVMALQFGFGLERFGAASYVGKVVSLGFVMELGPVLTALLVGGRVGAGITAELGSMSVTEQIDAMRALGADPVKKLVVPRVLACVITMPILALMADVVGTIGGMLVAVADQGVTWGYYLDQVITSVNINHLLHGLIKSAFFGFFYGIIGCYKGLQTRGGTEGVGRATTETVVITSITILVGDFILGKVMLPFMT